MNVTGLTNREEELIREVFRRHQEVAEARLFGSRAKGCAEPASDIDLAIWGDLTARSVARLAGDLEELPLPYRFDVLDADRVEHQPLREHIEQVGKVFYRR